jgi:hypothetical protein
MSEFRKIAYVGSDSELLKNIHSQTRDYFKDECVVDGFEYEKASTIYELIDFQPRVVFFDTTSIKNHSSILKEVLFLKSNAEFSATLFVAVWPDEFPQKKQEMFYLSGFTFGYIKGGEVELLLRDAYDISFGFGGNFPEYAKAVGIERTLSVNFCSSISKINWKEVFVDTDYEPDEFGENLNMELPIFSDLETSRFKISGHSGHCNLYPKKENYSLKLPYAGPWDEVSNETLQRETVETWLELNEESFSKRDFFIKVVSIKEDLLKDVFALVQKNKLFVDVSKYLDNDKIRSQLQSKKPDLIFVDIAAPGEAGNGIESIEFIIRAINSIDGYNPIITVFNTKTKPEALQKVYGYTNIVCIPREMSFDLVEMFVESFIAKKKESANKSLYFKVIDPRRIIDIDHSVVVQTLSEHTITFLPNKNIPSYSVLRLELPIQCFITTIPNPDKYSRETVGIINGITEEQRETLRRFVNQIIYSPINEFSSNEVERILKGEAAGEDEADAGKD